VTGRRFKSKNGTSFRDVPRRSQVRERLRWSVGDTGRGGEHRWTNHKTCSFPGRKAADSLKGGSPGSSGASKHKVINHPKRTTVRREQLFQKGNREGNTRTLHKHWKQSLGGGGTLGGVPGGVKRDIGLLGEKTVPQNFKKT